LKMALSRAVKRRDQLPACPFGRKDEFHANTF
jgi:hypothetical protein